MQNHARDNALEELRMLAPGVIPKKISYSVDAAFFAHQKGKKDIRGFTSGLIITPDNKIVLARRQNWFMPGGGVEIGETFAETMAREISEEVGIAVYDLSLITIEEEEFIAPDGDMVVAILGVFAMKTDVTALPPLTTAAKEEGIEDMALFSLDALPSPIGLTDKEKIITYFNTSPVHH